VDLFWNKKQGWYGKQLDDNIKRLADGYFSKAPWVFCVLAEKHAPSKLSAAKALCEALEKSEFDDIIRIDRLMRLLRQMERSIDWRKLKIEKLFTSAMNADERRAVIVFASFNPDGFIREQAVRLMAEQAGTLPYIILRLNDWVPQVRQSAADAFNKRLNNLSSGELLAALPFAEKLKRKYAQSFFSKLASREYREDLKQGLDSHNLRTRRICVQALLDADNPDFELAFQHLKRETDPFIRKMIYEKLLLMKQDMTEYLYVFLRDRYFANRILALQYLNGTKKNGVMQYAEPMLLDRYSIARGLAREIVQEHIADFDFSKFYSEHIESRTVPAICGLGETGSKSGAKAIEPYLNDTRVNVARASIIALMRLDHERFEARIIDMLGDSRESVAKTARQMLVKYGVSDYNRIHEIFHSAPFEHSKIKCATILFSAPKWQSLIYMLEAASSEMKAIRDMAVHSIGLWLFKFNVSFVAATNQEQETIKQLTSAYGGSLPDYMKRELMFIITQAVW
jgi:hypothetical protein